MNKTIMIEVNNVSYDALVKVDLFMTVAPEEMSHFEVSVTMSKLTGIQELTV